MNLKIFYKSFIKNLEKHAGVFFSDSFNKLNDSSIERYDSRSSDDYSINSPTLPATSAAVAQEILKRIQQDSRLTNSSKSKLLSAIKKRPTAPKAGANNANIILGAGLGAAAMHLLNKYLKSRPGKDSEELRSLAMLGSGALSGGLLGASLSNDEIIPEENDEWSL